MPTPIYTSLTMLTPVVTSQYHTYLVSVVGGSTWVCLPGFVPTKFLNQPAPSTTLISSTQLVGMAQLFGDVFIVDGSSTIFQANLSTLAMSTYTISSSTSTSPAPQNCRLASSWRGRLILSGSSTLPAALYASRAGNPFDWNYAAGVTGDTASAFLMSIAAPGQIAEPIIALASYSSDYFVVACANSLWLLEGDLAAGGSPVRLSDHITFLGPNAWTVDSMGALYFVGTGGLYRLHPMFEKYTPPVNISNAAFNQYFSALGWNKETISLAYDGDLNYLYIFATPIDSSTSGIGPDASSTTHLVYDLRNGGFWPQQFPGKYGPTAALQYMGDNHPNSRCVLIGGWDGYIRAMDQGAFDDDSSTVYSRLTLGSWQPAPEQAVLSAVEINLGEVYTGDAASTWNVDVSLLGGANAFSVTDGSTHNRILVNCALDQRQKTIRQRVRGGWFALQLQNSTDNTYWSFEGSSLEFLNAGRNRERR